MSYYITVCVTTETSKLNTTVKENPSKTEKHPKPEEKIPQPIPFKGDSEDSNYDECSEYCV